jgi:hypothetical protein
MKNIKSITDFLNENIDDSILQPTNDENITIDITKIKELPTIIKQKNFYDYSQTIFMDR